MRTDLYEGPGPQQTGGWPVTAQVVLKDGRYTGEATVTMPRWKSFIPKCSLGILSDEDAVLDRGQSWQPKPQEKPVIRQGEFPIEKAVVNFQ
jgi:hypothetical protein